MLTQHSQAALIVASSSPALGYGPIVVLILFAALVAASIILITHILPKAKRSGAVKDGTYESGVEPIGDARQRFNVRFYLVAMLFLLFDVELVFMYPWALLLTSEAQAAAPHQPTLFFLFWSMAVFFLVLVIGFTYDWKRGAFRYD